MQYDGSYRWREADKHVVANLRFRWKQELAPFSDLQVAEAHAAFSLSADVGNNDEKFPEWFPE